jgi:hypothetical protein
MLLLAVLGLFRSPWSPVRFSSELLLLLGVIGSLIPLTAIMHGAQTRYYFVFIPFLIIWASNGINELTRWAQGTIVNLRMPAPLPDFGAKAVGGLAFLSVLLLFAIGAKTSDSSPRENSPESRAARSAGEWLRALPGEKTIMDTSTTLAFHAAAKYVPMPYCDSRTALKYAEKKHVNFIVIRTVSAPSRPYLQEWLQNGIPRRDVTLVHTFGSDPSNQISIFRLNNTNRSESVTTSPFFT